MAAISPFRCITVVAALAMATAQFTVAQLKPEYVSKPFYPSIGTTGGSKDYYVFLQRFPLNPAFFFFHTEVLVCPRTGFSAEDQGFLDQTIATMTDFAKVNRSWWRTKTAGCVELGYGGSGCIRECCSVGGGHMPLNKRRAVISNANVWLKALYIYGTGAFDGNTAFHHTCDKRCWSMWSGISYNPVLNNCNTFTSTVLSCVYGLSQKKPHLSVSDLITVHGHCPKDRGANSTDVLVV
eukprot:CAMPEP_0171182722 /NCGR_PEP_ID=MMETSP0790-20130122/14915_1 /TAXON_ID=2925 /ORGANISM="Alexandrium catenella, Strain OF101" /LENGTH=237 /DNA_ID=CAMNT_0011647687 /DNA_START=58 /DNA_END=771 /DNA_ORIENTATION=+